MDRFRILALLCIFGTGPSTAYGQAEEEAAAPFLFGASDYVVFPDGGRVFSLGQDGLRFEAQIAPDVRIFSNLYAATQNVFDVRDENFRFHWGLTAYATVLVRLRMFDEDSSPVRAPSYMPKGTLQVVGFKSHADPTAPESTRYRNSSMSMIAFTLPTIGHHSNGQNGCAFEGYESANGVCKPDSEVASLERSVNKRNGSFSTNYVRLGIQYRWMRLDDEDQRVDYRFGGGIDFERHLGIDPSDTLMSNYGKTRVRMSLNGAWRDVGYFGRIEARYGLGVIRDPNVGKRHRLELFLHPYNWGGAGIYARYYHGQDYYNISFTESISRFDVGVAFNDAKFLDFGIPQLGQ